MCLHAHQRGLRARRTALRPAKSRGLALATTRRSKIQTVSTVPTTRLAASDVRRVESKIAGSALSLNFSQVLWVWGIR